MLARLLEKPFAMLAAGFLLVGVRRSIPARIRRTGFYSICGSQGNLQIVDFLPLLVGTLPFWNGQKLLQAKAGRRG